MAIIYKRLASDRGTAFLVSLWGALLMLFGVYSLAHLRWFQGDAEPPTPCELIHLDRFGRVSSLSELDLKWYLGRDAATAVETKLKENSNKIAKAKDGEVAQALLEFEIKYAKAANDPDLQDPKNVQFVDIRGAFESGQFGGAARGLREFVENWSADTQQKAGEASLFNLMYQLEQLDSLKKDNSYIRQSASIPKLQTIFWVRPVGALAEGVFWALFGTLVNLILNVSRARARGRYRPSEIWVSLSKIIYGPVLSLVFILWIYFGIIDASVEVRFWLLPLLGFIFGYNTQKTALLIDRLSDRAFQLFGADIEKLGAPTDPSAARTAAQAVAGSAKPTSLAQLKDMGRKVAEAHLTAALISSLPES